MDDVTVRDTAATAGTDQPEAKHDDPGGPAVEKWTLRVEPLLVLAALAFFAAYAAPIINPDLSARTQELCGIVNDVVWIIFAIDYGIKVFLARQRLRYVVANWFDLIIVVLPFFQPLRMLRLLFLLKVLNRRAGHKMRGQVAAYVSVGAVVIIIVGALAMLDAERGHPGATITNYGDSLWWATVTVLTVGYGDYVPVSGTGRLIATVLMIVGIAVLGAATAILASWLVQTVTDDDTALTAANNGLAEAGTDPALEELAAAVRAQSEQLADLQDQLRQLRGPDRPDR